MGFDAEKDPLPSKLKSPTITDEYTTFPIIGEIAAGYDNIILEDWCGDTIQIPNEYMRGYEKVDFIVLRVKGQSMYPMYQDGDIVLVLKQSTVNKSGDIGAIIYENELVTLKKLEFVYGEDWLKLVPLNPEYEPKLIEGEELEHCKVIGIPKLLIREFN
jgi:repressor LexA